MDHRIMMGMFLGGVVMMAPPVLLGIGIGIFVLRQQRATAHSAPAADMAAVPPGPAERREGGNS
jgi:hypothetical protein